MIHKNWAELIKPTQLEVRPGSEPSRPATVIAEPLERIAAQYPEIDIGSYPFSREGRFGANLVVRGTDVRRLEEALAQIVATMAELGGDSSVGPSSSLS